ncbi:tigger transposable element-derived protein 4-like [Anastrepha ludens]|uniref:tigger transposable element-derived protein 4-like n=1 Tax=Anastrepha ludens TaxID=28586 RepID=UPI0023AF270A|nr:tigger transposable element-derived protein 4-like [Anastrepha ludens]
MSSKRCLKTLSIDEKFKLIKEVEMGARKKDVAVKYAIPANTVSTILKNKQTVITAIESGGASGSSKRLKKPTYVNVDKAVLEWFKSARTRNLPISGGLLKEKALEFSQKLEQPNFKASTGWLDSWKRRSGICHKKACGESNDVSEEDCMKWQRDVLPYLLEGYQARDVFNADETGLFFKCLPDNTLTLKNQKCHGGKHSKQRVMLMIAANMDGSEKLKLLLIGKSNQPRCFRGVKWLPLDYKANSKAWMTGAFFEEWLLNLDKQFGKAGRNILLFIDNCPAHPKDIQQRLKFIQLAFFPPNMTSKLQPLDQGVIQNLKCHYRRRILKNTIKCFEVNKNLNITLMDCVDEITNAWNIDVKPETISNCFRKAGFGQYSEWQEEDDIPLVFISERIKERSKEEIQLQNEYEAWQNIKEFPTDEDIVELLGSKSEFELDSESDIEDDLQDDMLQPVSNELVANSFKILRSYLKTNEHTTDSLYNGLNNIEAFFEDQNKKSSRQSQITDFFTLNE